MPTLYVKLETGRGFENAVDLRIVLRAGQQEHQTLAGNGPGAASFQTERFTFPLGETDVFFELEAWSAGALGAIARGKALLDLRQLQPDQWQRKVEALSGPAENIEIEFELYLSMANLQEEAAGGSLNFSAQEIEHYRHLLSLVDTDGTGLISSTTGASFLSNSGLPDTVLGEIWQIAWQIADTNFLTADIAQIWQRYGFLTVEAFFVALRLVAHAQTHSQPSLELATVSPPALPEFRGLMHRAVVEQQSSHGRSVEPAMFGQPALPEFHPWQQHGVVEQQSSRGCSVAASGQGTASNVSGQGAVSDDEWQPVIGGSLDPPHGQPQGPPSRLDGATASSYSSGRNPRRPFKSQDWFPTACEKKEYASLFRTCDADSDGFVERDEAQTLLERSSLDTCLLAIAWDHADQDKDGRLTFKEFVTLVHLVTCTLRGAQLPTPVEGLPQELLQAVDELMQEAGSSVTPGPVTTTNAPPEEATVVVDGMLAEWNQPWPDAGQETAATVFTEGLGEETHSFAACANAASAFNNVIDFGDASAAVDSRAFPLAQHTSAIGEGSVADACNGEKELQDFQTNALTAVTAHLEALTGMDKDLVRQLQLDVVELEEELQFMQQSQNEQVVRAEHSKELQQRQSSMVIELERDVQDTKKQLHRLREQRDNFRINSEINFLKRMLDEEERTLEEVLRASRIIGKSLKDVQAGTEAIEGQRKLIQKQVAAEEELLCQAKLQNAEMTSRVEHFRRQQVAVSTESHEEHEREKRLRDIKASTAANAAPNKRRQVSWHGNHVTPHLAAAFTGRGDVARPIFRTAVLVGGREGV